MRPHHKHPPACLPRIPLSRYKGQPCRAHTQPRNKGKEGDTVPEPWQPCLALLLGLRLNSGRGSLSRPLSTLQPQATSLLTMLLGQASGYSQASPGQSCFLQENAPHSTVPQQKEKRHAHVHTHPHTHTPLTPPSPNPALALLPKGGACLAPPGCQTRGGSAQRRPAARGHWWEQGLLGLRGGPHHPTRQGRRGAPGPAQTTRGQGE